MPNFIVVVLCALCFALPASSQEGMRRFRVTEDIEVFQISRHCYVHVSYTTLPRYGRIGSNGIVYVIGSEALLFDTPMTDSLTKPLVQWIGDSLHARIAGFVPNHWHNDCMGGLGYLDSLDIPSYACDRTIAEATAHGLAPPRMGFANSLALSLGRENVFCKFLGEGHAHDNIVTWFPSDSVLFAGCMVKELAASSLGNLSDANVAEWPKTIKRVITEFPDASIVVPGHGAWGGQELLKHTLELLAGHQ
jgi:metallo-beta-lactamase class B